MAKKSKTVDCQEVSSQSEENGKAIQVLIKSLPKIIHDQLDKYFSNGGGELVAKAVKKEMNNRKLEADASKWRKMNNFIGQHWWKPLIVLYLGWREGLKLINELSTMGIGL